MVNRAREEIPDCIKSGKEALNSTKIKNQARYLQFTSTKRVVILSSMHSGIGVANNSKKTPETISFYNETKYEITIGDQLARQYSVKASSRR